MGLHKANQTSFKKGNKAYNKGEQLPHVKKKIKLFEEGKKISCIKHGSHLDWRKHSNNNVQCKKCSKEWQSIARKNKPITFLLRDALSHANSKFISFTLTEQDIVDLLHKQNNKCALSGIEFSSDLKFSLDRIDPSLGYILPNVQLVIFEVNRMKTNLSQERFLELCKLIARKK